MTPDDQLCRQALHHLVLRIARQDSGDPSIWPGSRESNVQYFTLKPVEYQLAGPDGAAVEPVSVWFRDLRAAGRSQATVRSYGMDLLRWFRFLWAIGLPWERATRVEARDFCLWLLIAGKRDRAGGGGAGEPYAVSVRAHAEPVIRDTFGVKVVIQPDPGSARGWRVHSAYPVR